MVLEWWLFSCSVMSNSLQLHGLSYTSLPCSSLSPRVCSNSCLLSGWCHPTISSSAAPFSSCSPSFLASGSFPISCLFTSGSQSTGASASASVLPMYIQGYFLSDWLVWSACSPPALNLSQHQGLFICVSSLHQVAKVLEFQFQHQSFQWTPRTDLL